MGGGAAGPPSYPNACSEITRPRRAIRSNSADGTGGTFSSTHRLSRIGCAQSAASKPSKATFTVSGPPRCGESRQPNRAAAVAAAANGERTNTFIVADSNEPIVLYRKCLLRCEISVNGYNLAVEKNRVRHYC